MPGVFSPIAYVEVEAYCIAALATCFQEKTLPEAPVWTSLERICCPEFRDFVGEALRGQQLGLLYGGIPCQPFSVAGKREGAKDVRWLWPFVREALRTYKPRAFFLENVRGFVRGGLGLVISDLADLGYLGTYDVFSAAEVGAPHRRERLFLLATRVGDTGVRDWLRVCLPQTKPHRDEPQDGIPRKASGHADGDGNLGHSLRNRPAAGRPDDGSSSHSGERPAQDPQPASLDVVSAGRQLDERRLDGGGLHGTAAEAEGQASERQRLRDADRGRAGSDHGSSGGWRDRPPELRPGHGPAGAGGPDAADADVVNANSGGQRTGGQPECPARDSEQASERVVDDTAGPRRTRRGRKPSEPLRQQDGSGEPGGRRDAVGYTEHGGVSEGQRCDGGEGRQPDADGADGPLDDAARHGSSGRDGQAGSGRGVCEGSSGDAGGAGADLDDARRDGLQGQHGGEPASAHSECADRYAGLPLFPPGPGDRAAWQWIAANYPELLPAVRGPAPTPKQVTASAKRAVRTHDKRCEAQRKIAASKLEAETQAVWIEEGRGLTDDERAYFDATVGVGAATEAGWAVTRRSLVTDLALARLAEEVSQTQAWGALHNVADGPPDRMGGNRSDALRACGNSVVALCCAAALVTLARRLICSDEETI